MSASIHTSAYLPAENRFRVVLGTRRDVGSRLLEAVMQIGAMALDDVGSARNDQSAIRAASATCTET
jgi:hypothetical protein